MSDQTVFRNARLVLHDTVLVGSLQQRDGLITHIDAGAAQQGMDLQGDYLLPGLVELHTDHLETHYAPRPGVRWSMLSAIQAHDAQVATSGITTVFDCLRMGSDEDDGFAVGEMRAMADAIEAAQTAGRLRCEHHLHLRCEVSAQNVMTHLQGFEQDHRVRLVSMMDHAPGQRQFACMEQYSAYYKTGKGMSDAAFERFVAGRQAESERFAGPHRRQIARLCRQRGIALASHDDATAAHVREAQELGVCLAEFPTTVEAARAAHEAGQQVLMGAPNLVRGASHSGNVGALELAEAGVLDVLSSDYIPFSLLHAAFRLGVELALCSLPAAVALITRQPALAVGLEDRGSLQVGQRADLVHVRYRDELPQVCGVWRAGRRVA